jgi:hypothetical protein
VRRGLWALLILLPTPAAALDEGDVLRHLIQTRPAIGPAGDVVDLRRRLDRLATRRPQDPELSLLERRIDAIARGVRVQHPALLPELAVGRRPPPRLHRGRPVAVDEETLPEIEPRPTPERGGLERAVRHRVTLIEHGLETAARALAEDDAATARARLADTRTELESLVRLHGPRLDPAEIDALDLRLEALERRVG